MNIAHNFLSVADAPLCPIDAPALLQMLGVADLADKYYVIVSKQAKPGYMTTAYSESGHVLFRAKHRRSIRQALALMQDTHPGRIRLLADKEPY